MSDNSRRVSRRTALKGIATVASTGVVGAGGIIHAAEPAAAVEHQMTVDDITIETLDGEITEFGISDMWVEVSWENIPDELMMSLAFRHDDVSNGIINAGIGVDLGVDGDGSQTFGYGEMYEDDYNVDLTGLNPELPFVLTHDYGQTDNLDLFELNDAQDEKTVENVRFEVRINSYDVDESGSLPYTFLDSAEGSFDVTVVRVEPEGDAGEGDAEAFGSE